MPNSTNHRGRTVSSSASSGIPSISLDSNDLAQKTIERKVPTARTNVEDNVERLTIPAPPKKPQSQKKRAAAEGSRVVADIADLAKPKDKNAPIPGVDVFESPQYEILKDGGPFDKYIAQKTAEMKERMAYEEEKRQIEEFERKEQMSRAAIPNAEDIEMDADEEEILKDINYSKIGRNIKLTVVVEEYEDEEVVEEETATGGINSREEMLAALQTSAAPFYTSTGAEDDYEYPESYTTPIDEEESYDDEEEDEVVENDTMYEEEEVETVEEQLVIPEVVLDVEEPVEDTAEEDVTDDSDYLEEEHPTVATSKIKVNLTFDNDDDLEKESVVDTAVDLPSDEQRLEDLKAEISRKIKPKAKKLDLSTFTIVSKTTASNKIFESKETSAAKWVLPTTGICVQMREISGQKIEYLRENSGANPTAARNALKVIYDHIISPKPQSFEQWTKTIAYADYDHLYMPVYMAAFTESNYMPNTCARDQRKAPSETGCGNMFLSSNLDIMKLVKFKDKDSEKKFWQLYNSNRTNPEGLYTSEIVPVSERFAIEFTEPTLYSVMLEAGAYGDDFARKYDSVIAFLPYISRIFLINQAKRELCQITYQKYENNTTKTAKSKVIKYANLLDTLTVDEYTNVVSIITSINDKNDWLSYRIPEMKCPECGRNIDEEPLSAAGLVFTRHRLGLLANS